MIGFDGERKVSFCFLQGLCTFAINPFQLHE
jgi:hypothetical protein